MRKITIKKNRHYPCLIPFPLPFWVNKHGISIRFSKIMFTGSCMYNLVDEDQLDTNKLFGFSIGHHRHGSSFRFGWRPLLDEGLIEIISYEYHDGVRQKIMPICKISPNKWYEFSIAYSPVTNRTIYLVDNIRFVNNMNLRKKYGWGYCLGFYFGGNEKAPQNISIYKKA